MATSNVNTGGIVSWTDRRIVLQLPAVQTTFLAGPKQLLVRTAGGAALDPVATLRIEQLMTELREDYKIVIVTPNLQQASRVSDETAFFSLGQDRAGFLVEMDSTTTIFTNPRERLTEDYVSGRFG